jgi:hypothetical protein
VTPLEDGAPCGSRWHDSHVVSVRWNATFALPIDAVAGNAGKPRRDDAWQPEQSIAA